MWTPCWEPFFIMCASKIVPESEKPILWKWDSRLHEVIIFRDLDPQDPFKNRWKLDWKIRHLFHRKIQKIDWRWLPKCLQQPSKRWPKNTPTHQRKNDRKKSPPETCLSNEREARSYVCVSFPTLRRHSLASAKILYGLGHTECCLGHKECGLEHTHTHTQCRLGHAEYPRSHTNPDP